MALIVKLTIMCSFYLVLISVIVFLFLFRLSYLIDYLGLILFFSFTNLLQLIFYYSLLMPKIIAPRRTSKNVTVDDFWAIRQKLANKKQAAHHVYKQKQVANRNRFQGQKEQIKNFNPLQYFLSSTSDFSSEQKTHSHAYLQTIKYHLPQQIMQIKKHMFGLASILKNIEYILQILCSHLKSEDSWILIECLLKDTRQEAYEFWVRQGISQLVAGIGMDFVQSRFKVFFRVFCVLVQVCFNRICRDFQSLIGFLDCCSVSLFSCKNKYIRRFSLECISYLITNLDQPLFKQLINTPLTYPSIPTLPHLPIILSHRLKYSQGNLTPNSIQQLVETLKYMKQYNTNEQIVIKYISSVLSNLQQKYYRKREEKEMDQENCNLFDFDFVIKAFVGLVKEGKVVVEGVVGGVVGYLEEPRREKRNRVRRLSQESLKNVSEMLWEYLPALSQKQGTYHLLALSFNLGLQNVGNIKGYIQKCQEEHELLQFLNLLPEELSKQSTMLVMASCGKHIQNFLSTFNQSSQKLLLVYKLFLLVKHKKITINVSKMLGNNVNLSTCIKNLIQYHKNNYKLTINDIDEENNPTQRYLFTLIFLRFLTVFDVSDYGKQLGELMTLVISRYSRPVSSYLSKSNTKNSSIFFGTNYAEEIFLYSHSSIPIIWQGFNLIEAFIELQKLTTHKFIDRSSASFKIWHRLIINRPSIVAELPMILQQSQLDSKSEKSALQTCLLALQSRHRTTRMSTLQHLHLLPLFCQHKSLLQMLMSIDEDIVDLQTQRNVKRILLDMLRYVQNTQLSMDLNNVLICWSLGFAFTGFKLIQQSFANFLAGLLQCQNNAEFGFVVRFLQYYAFRNSRVYEQQIGKFFVSQNQQQVSLELEQVFVQTINKDFENYQLDTVEFIGVDRVTLAISKSEKVKQKLGDQLLNILNQYFQQQFFRAKNILRNGNLNPTPELLLPPKTTFLKQILKLVPSTYIPPLQCLHYTQDYLQLQSIRKIKHQSWQALWHKSTKQDHSRVLFGSMSEKQTQIYIHFLWGEILKADANRLRIIIEYIRDYINHKVSYFVQILLEQLTMGANNEEGLKRVFLGIDNRKMLTYVYVLKAVVKVLKNYVRDHFEDIFKVLTIMVDVFDVPANSQDDNELEKVNENQNENENENDSQNKQDQNSQQQSQQKQQRLPKQKKYKNHRKQVHKILTSLTQTLSDTLSTEQIQNILNLYHEQKKIQTLGQTSLNSTPGLLLFFKQLSKIHKFHYLFIKYQILEQICYILANGGVSLGSASVCVEVCNGLLGMTREDVLNGKESDGMEEEKQSVVDSKMMDNMLDSILKWLVGAGKIRNDIEMQLFVIALHLMQKCQNISSEWENYLLPSLSKLLLQKSPKQSSKLRVERLLHIALAYIRRSQSTQFLMKLMPLIPQLKQISHRKMISDSISLSIIEGRQTKIGQQAVSIVSGLNSTIDGGLVIEIDYSSFFEAINLYKARYTYFRQSQHQFVIYNLLAYLSSQELSVRKAVSASLELFLIYAQQSQRDLVSRMFRIVAEELKKPMNSEQQIFWSIFSCIGHFVRWIIKNDIQNAGGYSNFAKFISETNSNVDVFEMLIAISQSKKMEGLKAFKAILKQEQLCISTKLGDKYPNVTTTIFLPVLQHFILPIQQTPNNKYDMAGNLTSSLSHVSLEIYEQVMKRGGESLQKKQLKRMISKLKFDEVHLKKNILLIKIIGQIVEGIPLPKATDNIHEIVEKQGFEDFHKKLLQKQSKTSKIKQEDSSDQQEQLIKKLAFNGYNNQIDDNQLINMGYMNLDKKLMQAEQQQNPEQTHSPIINFMKINVLIPLKTMLMFQNRNNKKNKQENDKSRMFLSTVVTKIILKFPIDIFVVELQKILSKICKLLKKREVEVRDNARKCLVEICRLIGTDMLYLVFRELKFHLRDNFQNHIMNYTIYYILQKYGTLPNSSIDHCLPILLPSIIDQIYGKTATQKQQIEQHLIPTLNIESKKRKSNDLLSIICRQIGMNKIEYLIKYLQKFLLEFMNNQTNVSRYQQMLTNIIGGFSKNQCIMRVENSERFVDIVYDSVEKLKGQIKLYKFQDVGVKHQSTVKQQHSVGKKVGKQALEIQEQAARNASIFKKQAKIIQQRRNHEILVGCFMQLHLALLALLIKKKIIDSQEHSHKFQSILTFIVQCIEHRDNRLVHKCLKVIHNVIHWKNMPNIAQIRKKASRKIFALIQKLTSADEDLLRECFTLLNDLFEEVNITADVLHILLTIIKLHITTAEQTIAQEPYKLLKTVLIKISNDANLMQDPAVYELYEFVRATLISTTIDHIRSVCRQICSLYIRQHPQSVTNSKKKHGKPTIDFRKQISFYLNNLDCKYSETQLALLDVIKAYVSFNNKQEIQETGEVIIMALGTAFSNDADNEFKIGELIKYVLQKIDNSKIIGLIDKCLLWAANDDHELISICGFFLLFNILSVRKGLLNHQRKLKIATISTSILQKQQDKVEIFVSDIKERAHQMRTLKDNPEWEGIIQNEQSYLKLQKNFKFAIGVLEHLFEQQKIMGNNQVKLLWKLASAPSALIHEYTCRLLLKVERIAGIIGQVIFSTSQDEDDSLKNKVMVFVKNVNQADTMQHACEIIKKVLQQIKQDERAGSVCQAIIFSLFHKISKSILNLKKNQKSMSLSYDMLQIVFSFSQQICQHLLKCDKLVAQMFWNIAKVNRNQMIQNNIKEKNQQFSDIIKNAIGEAEFYRRLAAVEADRRQMRATQKAEFLKLAVTDQEAYGRAKAKKKHKKQ